jgi:opacity protein-like surface antigen
MKNIAKSAVLSMSAILFSHAAHAQTYVGVSAGVSLPEDAKHQGEFTSNVLATTLFPAITNGTAIGWETEYEPDLNLGFQIGHRFENGFRVEAELNYSNGAISKHKGMTFGSTNVDPRDSRILTRHTLAGPTPTVGDVLNSGKGSEKSYGVFANVFYDLNHKGRFLPYVGAGAGLQRIELDYRPTSIDLGQSKATNVAWQVMGGATFKITEKFELFGQYTYRDNGSLRLNLDVIPASVKHDSRQSIVAAGIRVALGK